MKRFRPCPLSTQLPGAPIRFRLRSPGLVCALVLGSLHSGSRAFPNPGHTSLGSPLPSGLTACVTALSGGEWGRTMGRHFQTAGGQSATSPGSLSPVFNLCLCLCLCVSPRSRICGLQGQCEKPQKCPCFPLLSWCSVPSQGLLTLARALTLEPLPNGDPEAAPRRVLALVP